MHPGLEPGVYRTKAGSIVTVSGKHGGRVQIDFDWFEESACCDAEPFVMEGVLHWACECHGDGAADLEPCDPAEGVCGQREAVRVVDVTVAENKPCDFVTLKVETLPGKAPIEFNTVIPAPQVLSPDETRPVVTDVLPSCCKHGLLRSDDAVIFNGRKWCAICIVDLLYREGVCEVTMKRVDR